jgi:hypothetical protein
MPSSTQQPADSFDTIREVRLALLKHGYGYQVVQDAMSNATADGVSATDYDALLAASLAKLPKKSDDEDDDEPASDAAKGAGYHFEDTPTRSELALKLANLILDAESEGTPDAATFKQMVALAHAITGTVAVDHTPVVLDSDSIQVKGSAADLQ